MKTIDITQPFFNVKPSKAALAVDARSAVSKTTCAIFTLAPDALGVGDHVTLVVWKPWYLDVCLIRGRARLVQVKHTAGTTRQGPHR